MADTARKVTYFYATVPDKAGEGSKVLEGLTTIEEVMRVTQEDLIVE